MCVACDIQVINMLSECYIHVLCRFFESHWFTWATQISHIPMEVNVDKRRDWVTMQVRYMTTPPLN